MLRITVQQDQTGTTLRLEGRLVGPWVKEVEACWRSARKEAPRRSFLIDLHSVTSIDHDGKALLRHLHEQGACFCASGCLMRSIVEEMTSMSQESKKGASKKK